MVMSLHGAANLPLGGGAAFFDDLLELIQNNGGASLSSGSHAIDNIEYIGEQRQCGGGALAGGTEGDADTLVGEVVIDLRSELGP